MSTTSKAIKSVGLAFLTLTLFFILFPLHVWYPQAALDPSWAFALNQAVAQNLAFGKDIIFSFGPYASVVTEMYHPAVYPLMIIGGLFMSLSYVLLVWVLGEKLQNKSILLLFLFPFLLLLLDKDALYFAYPFLVAIWTFTLFHSAQTSESYAVSMKDRIILFALLPAVGLLPLIKCSYLVASVGTMAILFFFLLYLKQKKIAFVSVLLPLFSIILFWLISGQELGNFVLYLRNFLPIVFGFSQAMSLESQPFTDVILYLVTCILIGLTIILNKNLSVTEKIFLFLIYGLFLFTSFKAGFVRHDGHVFTSLGGLLIATISIISFVKNRYIISLLFILAMVTYAVDDIRFMKKSMLRIPADILCLYEKSLKGIQVHLFDRIHLENEYKRHINVIQEREYIPPLQGTTDIYFYNIATLLASNNVWAPRPIFQSYSAYTPYLLEKNAQHLISKQAPDNILFKMQAIDGRFVSLEDGLSWINLIQYYEIVGWQNSYLQLQKRMKEQDEIEIQEIYRESHHMNDVLDFPRVDVPLLAEVNMKPTLIGKLLSFLFKIPTVEIKLTFNDGFEATNRFIPNMAKTKFLISPVVKNTKDFLLLSAIKPKDISQKVPQKMKIDSKFAKLLWKNEYEVAFYSWKIPENLSSVKDYLLNNIVADKISDETLVMPCKGELYVNDRLYSEYKLDSKNTIFVFEGWVVDTSLNDEFLTPDDIFIKFIDKNGLTQYIETYKDFRPDVNIVFSSPHLRKVGFMSAVKSEHINKDFAINVVYKIQNKLIECQTIDLPKRRKTNK